MVFLFVLGAAGTGCALFLLFAHWVYSRERANFSEKIISFKNSEL
jgi:hypothetical protein